MNLITGPCVLCPEPATTVCNVFIIEDNENRRVQVCHTHLAYLLDNGIGFHMHSLVFDPASRKKGC